MNTFWLGWRERIHKVWSSEAPAGSVSEELLSITLTPTGHTWTWIWTQTINCKISMNYALMYSNIFMQYACMLQCRVYGTTFNQIFFCKKTNHLFLQKIYDLLIFLNIWSYFRISALDIVKMKTDEKIAVLIYAELHSGIFSSLNRHDTLLFYVTCVLFRKTNKHHTCNGYDFSSTHSFVVCICLGSNLILLLFIAGRKNLSNINEARSHFSAFRPVDWLRCNS